jgi:two-component sensor histidine kinase
VLVESTSQAMADPDGHIQEFLTVTREVSGQKAQQEVEQESALQFGVPTEGSSRAEILLKEIHHRVKNNLQIVSSLLNLQSRSVSDTQTLDIMQESRSRIESIALIHEKLYQAQDLTQVNFADYIRDLSASLFRTYESAASGVTFITDLDSVLLDIDTAIPCGLMLNELVTNALKHAFPGERTGEVRIALHTRQQADVSHVVLTVADNGQGMPADLDIRQTRSLGFQLINALTSQIGGTLEVQRETGTEITIRFSAPRPNGEAQERQAKDTVPLL